jgi:prevent-host-death family protein
MKSIAISTFKTYALKLIAQVAQTHETIIITKRGKPIAELSPYSNKENKQHAGKLAHTLVFEKDIVSPLGPEMWKASK